MNDIACPVLLSWLAKSRLWMFGAGEMSGGSLLTGRWAENSNRRGAAIRGLMIAMGCSFSLIRGIRKTSTEPAVFAIGLRFFRLAPGGSWMSPSQFYWPLIA